MRFSQSIGSVYQILSKMGIYQLNNDGLIDAELAAYDLGFKRLEEKLAELKNNRFVKTANPQGLSAFEILMGISPRPNADAEVRRRLIINRLAEVKNGFSAFGLIELIKGAGIDCRLIQSARNRELTVVFKEIIDSNLSISQIEYFLDKLMPAHLTCIFEYGSISFDTLDRTDHHFDKWDSMDVFWDKFDQGDDSLLNS